MAQSLGNPAGNIPPKKSTAENLWLLVQNRSSPKNLLLFKNQCFRCVLKFKTFQSNTDLKLKYFLGVSPMEVSIVRGLGPVVQVL